MAGFLSTFWNFGYTRTALKMQDYLDAPPGINVPKVKKQSVRTPLDSACRCAVFACVYLPHASGMCLRQLR